MGELADAAGSESRIGSRADRSLLLPPLKPLSLLPLLLPARHGMAAAVRPADRRPVGGVEAKLRTG
ncbi:hypothetical protein GCM10010433_38560 [Streptomyces pulveraceus]|uniref:Uncharacterized protein n=1 Tax=Streptomyces pulveraceus TaxID=68258 RepID=A0ABW1GI80_9ACTN